MPVSSWEPHSGRVSTSVSSQLSEVIRLPVEGKPLAFIMETMESYEQIF